MYPKNEKGLALFSILMAQIINLCKLEVKLKLLKYLMEPMNKHPLKL